MEAANWPLLAFSIFFGIQALLHILKPAVFENYAIKRGFLSAGQAVKLTGLLLIVGLIMLWVESLRFYGGIALGSFSLIAAFFMHRFWDEKTGEMQLLELQNFLKNILIAAILFLLTQEW